jgi:hypothetical protein
LASRPTHSYRREGLSVDGRSREAGGANAAFLKAFKLAVAINVLACLLLLPEIFGHDDSGATEISAKSDYSGF